ncbi:MAG: transketolase family protein [Dorea sp.]|nr:transketolase family protein [Dorea sp.]
MCRQKTDRFAGRTYEVSARKMAEVYADTMIRLMNDNSDVVELEADLGACIMGGKMDEIDRYPGQLINCGIQEANMVGVACGLAAAGKIPFAHSFAPFISRRANDQIFISGCYSGANVRLVGSDPGIMAAYNGGTHMPFEDIAALRAFPGLTILEPTDEVMLEKLLCRLAGEKGMYYIRCARKAVVPIYEKEQDFTIGKGMVVKDGRDVTVIASGIMVAEALIAAERLEEEGISARVVDMFTIKPLDEELTLRCAEETGAIVTAENHSIYNGLGSAVCETLCENVPVPVERIGVHDSFGEVGDMEYLKKRFHLTAEDIVVKAKAAAARKKG